MVDEIPFQARRGRGAVSNHGSRFDACRHAPVDDGWSGGDEDALAASTATQVCNDVARAIITRNQSPDVPFELSVNPYRGCEHGCVYCFARPTHAYLGLSPGLDFETRLSSAAATLALPTSAGSAVSGPPPECARARYQYMVCRMANIMQRAGHDVR
jgi:hypothetical protein